VGRGRGQRLKALFACIYYAALRPEEAADLRVDDCALPDSGWGLLTLKQARPQSTKRWTDSGTTHESRVLKHRAEKETREVPIPPVLVAMLREHIAEYGAAEDGRIFRTTTGGSYSSSAFSRVWQKARELAFDPERFASPLAARPYDLRHAAVSLWLNAGVPTAEVAKRAGHSVEILLRFYARCMDGSQDHNNAKIELTLED
jgi:integrase